MKDDINEVIPIAKIFAPVLYISATNAFKRVATVPKAKQKVQPSVF
jgi:hypothetical protein